VTDSHNQTFVSGSWDRLVKMWDARSGMRNIATANVEAKVILLLFIRNNTMHGNY